MMRSLRILRRDAPDGEFVCSVEKPISGELDREHWVFITCVLDRTAVIFHDDPTERHLVALDRLRVQPGKVTIRHDLAQARHNYSVRKGQAQLSSARGGRAKSTAQKSA